MIYGYVKIPYIYIFVGCPIPNPLILRVRSTCI
nr:MAG TPA: hypothetical protein [Caudoviricetes sp.]